MRAILRVKTRTYYNLGYLPFKEVSSQAMAKKTKQYLNKNKMASFLVGKNKFKVIERTL